MGMEQERNGAWNKLHQIARKLESPHKDKIFVAKDYTKADLQRDILETIPQGFVSEGNV